MRTTKQMSITLPLDMAAMVENKVASGEYASDSEVVRDGLRALAARDRAVDAWLGQTVAPTYDRMVAGDGEFMSLDEAREFLAAQRGPTL